MSTWTELKETVKKRGFGSTQYNHINGDVVYLSRGVCETFLGSPEDEQKMIGLVSRFQKGDFGDAEAHGKSERAGHEYGRYETGLFEDAEEDTAVWVHKTEDALMVFFKFER